MKKRALFVIVLSVILVCCVMMSGQASDLFSFFNKQKNETVTIEKEEYERLKRFEKLADILEIVQAYYYEDVDEDAMLEMAARGLLAGVDDPYTFYYSAEDWKQMVRRIPMSRKMTTDPAPSCVQEWRKPKDSGVIRTWAVDLSLAKPTKNKANPMMISPRSFCFLDPFICIRTKPTRMRGKAKSAMLNENPNTAMIHAVTVVPMLAPIITPTAWPRTRRPAFTKLTTMMVVAVEDWIAAVTPMPVTICLKGLDVIEARKDLNPSPATFWSPPLNRLNPKRKSATDPRSVRICRNTCIDFQKFVPTNLLKIMLSS